MRQEIVYARPFLGQLCIKIELRFHDPRAKAAQEPCSNSCCLVG